MIYDISQLDYEYIRNYSFKKNSYLREALYFFEWSGREDLLRTSLFFALIPFGYSGPWRIAPWFKFAPCKLVNL